VSANLKGDLDAALELTLVFASAIRRHNLMGGLDDTMVNTRVAELRARLRRCTIREPRGRKPKDLEQFNLPID
jgi:hypothetical protein